MRVCVCMCACVYVYVYVYVHVHVYVYVYVHVGEFFLCGHAHNKQSNGIEEKVCMKKLLLRCDTSATSDGLSQLQMLL